MKALMTILAALFMLPALAEESAAADGATHRYVIERTCPAGALDGLDAATKEKVNANNATLGVRWLHSYANAEKTKTFCVYEGPSEDAVRQAAALNGLPVDSVMEVPVDLTP
jgi:predicted dinucleotide-utilizing enzyme